MSFPHLKLRRAHAAQITALQASAVALPHGAILLRPSGMPLPADRVQPRSEPTGSITRRSPIQRKPLIDRVYDLAVLALMLLSSLACVACLLRMA